jgi:hypothetical protein
MSNSFPRIFSIVVTALLTMTGLVAAATQVATAESVIAQLGLDIDGEAAGDRLNSASMSEDGSRIVVGALENDGFANTAGHARVFEYVGNSWVQLGQDIDGSVIFEKSGASVAMSADGTRVAIGATSQNSVRVYSYNGSVWTQVWDQILSEDAANDYSGHAVSLSSDGMIVAVSSPFNAANGAFAGQVRVFEDNGSAWVQVGQDINGEAADDQSGFAIDLSSDGTRLAIGTPFNDPSGHVRVFEYNDPSWVQLGLDIDGEAANDEAANLGAVSISANGNRVAIGSKGNDGGGPESGHVRVFEYVSDSWVQLGSDIDGKNSNERSGESVAMSSDGSRVVIGVPQASAGGTNIGTARVFDFVGGNWRQVGSDINGENDGDFFGDFVAMSGNGLRFAVGSQYHSGNGGERINSGHFRVFSIAQVNTPSTVNTSVTKLATTGSSELVTDLWIGSTLFVLTMGTAAMVFSRLRQRNNK